MRRCLRIKRFITIFVIGLFCFSTVEPVLAQQDATSLKQEDAVSEEREAIWTEDAEKKLETTIEVLEIIRQELKDVEFTTAPAQVQTEPQAPEETVATWASRAGVAIRAISRVWRKVRQATGKTLEEAGQAVTPEEEEADWSKDLSNKFDQAIESMKIIKKELDKIEEEQPAQQQ